MLIFQFTFQRYFIVHLQKISVVIFILIFNLTVAIKIEWENGNLSSLKLRNLADFLGINIEFTPESF